MRANRFPTLALAFGLLVVSSRWVAAAQLNDNASNNVLFYVPCHAWTEIHNTRGSEPVLEIRTVEFVRKYAQENESFLLKKSPSTVSKNAAGRDVSDQRIVIWITGWCAKNPDAPLAEGAFFLATAFAMFSDHDQLPAP